MPWEKFSEPFSQAIALGALELWASLPSIFLEKLVPWASEQVAVGKMVLELVYVAFEVVLQVAAEILGISPVTVGKLGRALQGTADNFELV